jgi:hypothetical protein
MAEEIQIGQWVRRARRMVWHRIESVIADDAITSCGRRMSDEPTARGGLLYARDALVRCRMCHRA